MSATHPLLRLLATDPKLVVGLSSSTSLDGINAALVEISGHGMAASARLLNFQTLPFPPGMREELERVVDPDAKISPAELAALDFRLGGALGEVALAVAGDHPIDLVGSHGQTVWHQSPWMKTRHDLVASTLQLGEPAVIAARTLAVTVGDFRVADLAIGGAGAPLSPYADWVLFRPREAGKVRALQDIGSKASVCIVGERLQDVFAFDNGPGTMLLGPLSNWASENAGAAAAEGRVMEAVLSELLDDDFLRCPPPKSTGHEHFGRFFAERLRGRYPRLRPIDLLSTARAFVAEAIVESFRAFVLPRGPVDEVLVSGAGTHQRAIMERLTERLAPLPVRIFDEAGIPADAKGAMAFALLAVEAIHASPANIVQATGARKPAVLGKICFPPV